MFNNIAGHYDFLNHFLSVGIDILWRRKAISYLKEDQPGRILDVATGTGDFAIEAMSLNPDSVIGIDLAQNMLDIGKKKISKKNLQSIIELIKGDAENLPFAENEFDAITVGFGVRNFENLEVGIQNMFRVLRPGGKVVILEFSKPKVIVMKQLYDFYFNNVLPLVGKMISKDNSAYTYLPESVRSFPDSNDFVDILQKAGFKNTECIPLSFGISSLYLANK